MFAAFDLVSHPPTNANGIFHPLGEPGGCGGSELQPSSSACNGDVFCETASSLCVVTPRQELLTDVIDVFCNQSLTNASLSLSLVPVSEEYSHLPQSLPRQIWTKEQ